MDIWIWGILVLLAMPLIGYVLGRWMIGVCGIPRKVSRALNLLGTDAAQVCLTFKGRHTAFLISEAGRRGFDLHDRNGDLLIFRKESAHR